MGPDTALSRAFADSCTRHADRTAIVVGDDRWSYRRLLAEVQAARQWFEDQFADQPFLLVPGKRPASVAAVVAGIMSTAVPLIADPVWTEAELTDVAHRCRARAIVAGGAAPEGVTWVSGTREVEVVADRADPVGLPSSPQTSFGRFSSGSTGRSRCLGFSSSAALAAADGWGRAAGLTERDRVLCLATLNNGLAFNASLLCVFLAGATLGLHSGRLLPRAVRRSVERFQPTVVVGFPFAFEQFAGPPDGVRLAVSSAARLDPAIAQRWRADGLPICDYYGLVEVGPCTFNDGTEPDSVGKLLGQVDCRILGDQRIRLRSPSMAHGYLDAGPPFSDHLDEQGYFVSADVGRLTDDGHLVLHGRVGRVVNLAGRKVDPGEIEDALRTLDDVTGVVVRAERSAGRLVLAAYVESDSVTRADVVQHCTSTLAAYKIPQLITVLPTLPRSSAGKVSLSSLPTSGGAEHEH